jgi:predicted 3-demethylubiquinone-9 3-methyltransferase (glyoxalase superfamily)
VPHGPRRENNACDEFASAARSSFVTITPFLWFDTEAEEAAQLYTSLFPNSRITDVTHYGESGPRDPGLVMTVAFELDGTRFLALNGGPQFRFTEAVSFVVDCADQTEVDRYWDALTANGGEESACGWLKDRFGLSWQIVPRRLRELMTDPDGDKVQRVVAAMLTMKKLEVAELEAAAA